MASKDKILMLTERLENQRNLVLQTWEKQLGNQRIGKKVERFLKSFYPKISFQQFCQDQNQYESLQSFLNFIYDNKQQINPQTYKFNVKRLRQSLINSKKSIDLDFKKDCQISQKHMLGKEPKIIKIDGEQILIQIIFNDKRMDPNYFFQRYKLKQYLQNFVKCQLRGENIKILAIQNKITKLRILEGKQQFKDNYTGTYTFDPFFQSVKIMISKRSQLQFESSFEVVNLNKIRFQFINDSSVENWIDQSNFKLQDRVENLIDYICLKQNAPFEIKSQLKEAMKCHGYSSIKDLMYNTKQSIEKVISKKKWANQIQSEVEKIRSPTRKIFTGNQNISDQKKSCFRRGNSHKILRYVFYKSFEFNNSKISGQPKNYKQQFFCEYGLKELNRCIPKINPQLMQKVINIVSKQLMIQDLFPDLIQYFKYFTEISNQKQSPKFQPPFGVLFHGPPGTGKTRLTEDLADLMGFHLVSHGISSAQFMKELVGQAKGTVHSYLKRPSVSKHLQCSLAIDQIDAIVADRRKQNTKSQQTISMFLSALGGNQAVPNILVFGSTNFRNLIDEAILRRLTPDFYVRLPSNEDRKKIILNYLPSLQKKLNIVNFLAEITPNYSGAAMKSLCQKYSLHKQINKHDQFNTDQLIQIADTVGINYKIKFGDQTYPQLYRRIDKQISLSFIKSTLNKVVLIIKQGPNQFKLIYAVSSNRWDKQNHRFQPFSQLKQTSFKLPQITINFSNVAKRMKQSFQTEYSDNNPKVILCNLQNRNQQNIDQLRENVYIINIATNRDYLKRNKIFQNISRFNTSTIYYIQNFDFFIIKDFYRATPYRQKTYTGRAIVDLANDNESKMIFQLKPTGDYPFYVENRPFFQRQNVKLAKDSLPQIVDFLLDKQVQYIQMINSQLLHDNNAFKQEDIYTLITSKVDQAKKYTNSSIIIDLSSLVSINRSVSQSSAGQNLSKNINQSALYHKLLELIKNFGTLSKKHKRWIFIIIQDKDLLDMLKRDAKWGVSPEQQEACYKKQVSEQNQKKKKQSRRCVKCQQIYTQEQNLKQKSCKQHYGLFVDNKQYVLQNQDNTIEDIRFKQERLNIGITDDKDKHLFKYSCCWRFINQEGCKDFHHWGGFDGETDIEHPQTLRQKLFKKRVWHKQCQQILEALLQRHR